MDLLALPKDLIGLLLNNYFHPPEALQCLMICKKLYTLGDKEKIIRNMLIYRMKQEEIKKDEEFQNNTIMCEKCNMTFHNQHSLKIHLNKHLQFEKQGKIMQMRKHPNPKTRCRNCNLVTSFPHKCLLTLSFCHGAMANIYSVRYPWADCLCKQTEWYSTHPNHKTHECYSRCKFCKQVFRINQEGSLLQDGYFTHFDTCLQRKKH